MKYLLTPVYISLAAYMGTAGQEAFGFWSLAGTIPAAFLIGIGGSALHDMLQ